MIVSLNKIVQYKLYLHISRFGDENRIHLQEIRQLDSKLSDMLNINVSLNEKLH